MVETEIAEYYSASNQGDIGTGDKEGNMAGDIHTSIDIAASGWVEGANRGDRRMG